VRGIAKYEVESKSDDADDADWYDMAIMSPGGAWAPARMFPKDQVEGDRGNYIKCEVSGGWPQIDSRDKQVQLKPTHHHRVK
jgi:hypothetical protein